MNKSNLIGHLSMFGANAGFGLLSPVSKIVMLSGVITPIILTEMRIAGAMVLFWVTSLFLKHEHVPHGDLLRFLFASLFAVVFNQGVFIFGVGLTTPGDASILTTSMPLWAMILAAVILKDPITGKKVLGIAAGAGGALMLILNSQSSQQSGAVHGSILGDLLVTLAQLSFAFYVVRFKDLVSRYSLFTTMKWLFTFSFIFTMPAAMIPMTRVPWLSLGLDVYLSILFIVVGATYISYVLVVNGQRRLRPTVVAMYNYVQPVVACLVAICLGLDSFNFTKGIAVVLIFSGVYLVTHSRTKEEIEAYHRAEAEKQAAAASKDKPQAEAKGLTPAEAGLTKPALDTHEGELDLGSPEVRQMQELHARLEREAAQLDAVNQRGAAKQ